MAPSTDPRFTAALDELHARWPGRVCVSLGEALTVVGVDTPQPERAADTRRRRGHYPFRITELPVRGARVVLLSDIAAALAGVDLDATPPPAPAPQPVHRGRGRPRKHPETAMVGGAA